MKSEIILKETNIKIDKNHETIKSIISSLVFKNP